MPTAPCWVPRNGNSTANAQILDLIERTKQMMGQGVLANYAVIAFRSKRSAPAWGDMSSFAVLYSEG